MRKILLLLLIWIMASSGYAKKNSAKSEKYIPTKLEWLVMELNVRFRRDEVKWSRNYEACDPDTVAVNILCNRAEDMDEVKALVAAIGYKEPIEALAGRRGWNWVKAKLNFRVLADSYKSPCE